MFGYTGFVQHKRAFGHRRRPLSLGVNPPQIDCNTQNPPLTTFRMTILQITPLFAGFYSVTLSVCSRKQCVCVQSTGGGYHPTHRKLRLGTMEL
jgi:hypothetical protein